MVLRQEPPPLEREGASRKSFSLDLNSDVSFIDEESQAGSKSKYDPPKDAAADDVALDEVRAMAKHETQGVRLWKIVVLLLMSATAAVVSAGTYIFLRAEEDDDYIESVRFLDKERILVDSNRASRVM